MSVAPTLAPALVEAPGPVDAPGLVDAPALLDHLRRDVIGDGAAIAGPYGPRPTMYVDWTASGRALGSVEEYLRRQVLPRYANTHTESSATGRAMNALREQARGLIAGEVGAGTEHAVIFCGSGVTAAIHKLSAMLPLTEQSVILVGPYEHHSNELVWRESPARVVVVAATADGRLDLADLARLLREHRTASLLVGCFSAASNVTGLITDVERVSSLLREHGALACWDYAAAGPYLPISMAGKDAVFLSPHKFLGGPQTPGILVVRRTLVPATPTVPGGGTIAFVSPYGELYAPDEVWREEGGTPSIVESVRAGLAFAVKRDVGTDLIHARHEAVRARVLDRWRGHPTLELLGNLDAPRLPIFSFRLWHGHRLLHHNFVVAVLSDLFGIQARGGCSCAGPYGHRLLRISPETSAGLHAECERGRLGVKPGWTRVSFPYVATDETVDYVLDAVDIVAAYGHRLLADYLFEPGSGLWRHRCAPPVPVSLSSYRPDLAPTGEPAVLSTDSASLAGYLDAARRILTGRPHAVADGTTGLPATFEALREFHLPPRCLVHGAAGD
jgi:selenocysteine lyase/cysteine desulfurase